MMAKELNIKKKNQQNYILPSKGKEERPKEGRNPRKKERKKTIKKHQKQ
jgi:hypothetical protein